MIRAFACVWEGKDIDPSQLQGCSRHESPERGWSGRQTADELLKPAALTEISGDGYTTEKVCIF